MPSPCGTSIQESRKSILLHQWKLPARPSSLRFSATSSRRCLSRRPPLGPAYGLDGGRRPGLQQLRELPAALRLSGRGAHDRKGGVWSELRARRARSRI